MTNQKIPTTAKNKSAIFVQKIQAVLFWDPDMEVLTEVTSKGVRADGTVIQRSDQVTKMV